jgi:hypothetical protein
MSAAEDFETFLKTLGLTEPVRRAIVNKFDDLRSEIIDECVAVEAESRRDGRRDERR